MKGASLQQGDIFMTTMKKLTIATALAGFMAASPLAAQDASDQVLTPDEQAVIDAVNELNACMERELSVYKEKAVALARPYIEASRAAMMQVAKEQGLTAEQAQALTRELDAQGADAKSARIAGRLVAEFTNLPGPAKICEEDRNIDAMALLDNVFRIADRRGYWVLDLIP